MKNIYLYVASKYMNNLQKTGTTAHVIAPPHEITYKYEFEVVNDFNINKKDLSFMADYWPGSAGKFEKGEIITVFY